MLYVTFKRSYKTDRVLLFPASDVFESVFDTEELTKDICKEIIKSIDNSEVVDANFIISPILGSISPSQLSGGSKAVLLALTEDQMISSLNLGDNCVKPLLKVSELKDVYVQCVSDLYIPNELFFEYQVYSLDKNRLFRDFIDFSHIQYEEEERFDL